MLLIEFDVTIFLINFYEDKFRSSPVKPFAEKMSRLSQEGIPSFLLLTMLFGLFEMIDLSKERKLRFVFYIVGFLLCLRLH